MKAMPASQMLYDNLKLEETEFALSVSPHPQIEKSKDSGKNTELAGESSGLERRSQAQRPRRTVFDEHDLTETLTIGWAMALAIAVALAVYASGG